MDQIKEEHKQQSNSVNPEQSSVKKSETSNLNALLDEDDEQSQDIIVPVKQEVMQHQNPIADISQSASLHPKDTQKQEKEDDEEHLSDFSDFSDQDQQQKLLKKRKRRHESGDAQDHLHDDEDNKSGSDIDGNYQDEGELDSYEGSLKMTKFIMKNGCCRECMKAFSKTGKSCLCQVPRLQRRATLPANGCKYCGCKGCNPIDIRRDKRQEIKNKLKKEGKYYSKRQRLLDSDDEELTLGNEYDDWNNAKKEFSNMISNLTHINQYLLGIGVPMRQPTYILGRPPEFVVPNAPREHSHERGAPSQRMRRDSDM